MHLVVKAGFNLPQCHCVNKCSSHGDIYKNNAIYGVRQPHFTAYGERMVVLNVKCHELACLEELSLFIDYGKRLSRLISFIFT